eukprot:TRINITY_DN14104_c0_g1_i1.p1 TRINITY_DN14104_c0_g1~~TRINITY_DN14104_c0_g1_i1.p1  ORF type:complete len:202 (-),score=-14.13 TRINITY_DN14104_c0_g1_i1:59-664(-)
MKIRQRTYCKLQSTKSCGNNKYKVFFMSRQLQMYFQYSKHEYKQKYVINMQCKKLNMISIYIQQLFFSSYSMLTILLGYVYIATIQNIQIQKNVMLSFLIIDDLHKKKIYIQMHIVIKHKSTTCTLSVQIQDNSELPLQIKSIYLIQHIQNIQFPQLQIEPVVLIQGLFNKLRRLEYSVQDLQYPEYNAVSNDINGWNPDY